VVLLKLEKFLPLQDEWREKKTEEKPPIARCVAATFYIILMY